MPLRFRQNQSGFTLIELLIVIAIIGILAVIANYQYSQYMVRAYDIDSKGTLKGLFIACKAYWHDNHDNNSCNATIASQTTYGFIAGLDVTVTGGGNEGGFLATGQHLSSSNSFTINSAGNIS